MQSTYIVYCFLGMLCFVIFGGVGLVVLPFDILLEFIYRPKPINQSEFKKRTKVLLPRIVETRKAGKKIEDERFLVDNIRGLTGYVKRMQFSSAMRRWETEILFCETEFVKLQDQADYANRVEPLVYVGKMTLFILCSLMSLNVILMIMTWVATSFNETLGNSVNYINLLINSIEKDNQNAMGLEYILNLLYILISLYMLSCATKGNDFYGYRYACFTFYAVT